MKGLRLFLLAVGFVLLAGLLAPGLGTGTAQAATLKIDPQLRAAMANGEHAPFLLVLSEQADLSGASRLATKLEKGRFVLNALQATASRTQPAVQAELDRLGLSYQSYYIVNLLAVEDGTQAVIEGLAARPDVARVESNARARMALPAPSDTRQPDLASVTGIPWGVRKINAPAVWSMGDRGSGIVYAGADTGVMWKHPALMKHYRGYAGGVVNHNYNWWDAVHHDVSGNGTNPCGFSSSKPCDDYGHGTHTMGTGIGDDGIGDRIGVAPGAKWIACRNMEEGWGSPSQYIECFQFFLAPWNLKMRLPNPDKNADVISNSWTCPPDEGCAADTLQAAVEAERAAGIFVVASAGNSGYAGCSSITEPPALYEASFTAGATDAQDNLAGFSSLGPITIDGSNRLKPDLSAPGVSVISSYYNGGYVTLSGTSMSAPHIAGAVALLWQARPKLRGHIDQTESALVQSAFTGVLSKSVCGGTSSQDIPNNLFGYGRLDILNAIKSVAP
ncbi:MAG: S8 family serine peptidase [Anaerolineae bacterium]